MVVFLFPALARVQAQPPDQMVDYLLVETNTVSPVVMGNLFPSEFACRTVATAPVANDFSQRLEKFEADFGVKQKDPSLVKSSIESAQYKLDQTVFAAKELVQDFRYDTCLADLTTGSTATRAPRRYYSDPLMDSWEHCQIHSGAEWDAKTGHAFVGVRLVLPFGD